jgi:hypothetical protein
MAEGLNDEQLVALLAAILSRGQPAEDFIQEAIALAGAARRAVEENKQTRRLRIDFEVETGCNTPLDKV